MTVFDNRNSDRLARLIAVVAGSTLALTAAIFGLIALATGEAGATVDRLPVYVLAMAATFVGVILLLEEQWRDAERILSAALGTAVGNFLLVSLATEGFVFGLRYPERVLSSQLLVYVLSAGLIATGLGIWLANHRDEFDVRTPTVPGRNRRPRRRIPASQGGDSETRSDGGIERL